MESPAVFLAPEQTAVRPRAQSWGGWRVLGLYFVVSYALVFLHFAGYLRNVELAGVLTGAFAFSVHLSYAFMLLAVSMLPALLMMAVFSIPLIGRQISAGIQRTIVLLLAVAGTSILQVFIYADRNVFDLYGFHFNGFVWNLIFTRGGLDSLGAGTSS